MNEESKATRNLARKTARPAPVATKVVNFALQGGGAHGAFGWGVMDKFLEDGRVEIEGVSGTSAGSMNAVVYAYGKIKGNDGANNTKAIPNPQNAPCSRPPGDSTVSSACRGSRTSTCGLPASP